MHVPLTGLSKRRNLSLPWPVTHLYGVPESRPGKPYADAQECPLLPGALLQSTAHSVFPLPPTLLLFPFLCFHLFLTLLTGLFLSLLKWWYTPGYLLLSFHLCIFFYWLYGSVCSIMLRVFEQNQDCVKPVHRDRSLAMNVTGWKYWELLIFLTVSRKQYSWVR